MRLKQVNPFKNKIKVVCTAGESEGKIVVFIQATGETEIISKFSSREKLHC
jgi:nitrate reductase NapAB chaperone NapD